MKQAVFTAFFIVLLADLWAAKEGTMVNPLTDISWECLFPITVSGENVTPGFKDTGKTRSRVCACAGVPPKIGIPMTYWEPSKLVEVTRHAYRLVGLGGVSIGVESVKNRGSVGIVADGPSQASFYHVHWYHYPLISLLSLFDDFSCMEKGDWDLAYLSELDPTWSDESLCVILNPEALLFDSLPAQSLCIADCTAASLGHPLDQLFWCGGCQGSLYPFSGSVAHHIGGVQASSLLVHRTAAKLHRMGLAKGFPDEEFCDPQYLPIIKKSIYKTQLVYPVAATGQCNPLGKTDLIWGFGKSFPHGGEDFVYLVWTKRHCCLDAVKPALLAGGL